MRLERRISQVAEEHHQVQRLESLPSTRHLRRLNTKSLSTEMEDEEEESMIILQQVALELGIDPSDSTETLLAGIEAIFSEQEIELRLGYGEESGCALEGLLSRM